MSDNSILGIDFGTRTSSAAVWRDGGTRMVSGWIGQESVDSTVSHTDGGTIYVGGSPADITASFPDRTVGSAKRYLRDVADGSLEFLRPQAFAAAVLRQLKGNAEEDLGGDVPGAVVAVPCQFDARQRQAVRDATEIAGFDHCRLVDETTAAAMSHYRGEWDDRTVLVFDLGAETLSTSVLDLGEGVYEVVATDGDLELGGNRWDDAIVEWFTAEVQRERDTDLREVASHRLKRAAETAKRTLSDSTETMVAVDLSETAILGTDRVERTLTRDHFEWLTEELVDRALDPVERTLEDAAYETHDIDEVLVVGDATAMPQIRQAIAGLVGIGPRKATASAEAVARGAAILGGVRSGHVDDVVTLPVTAQSLGVEVESGAFETLIERNTSVPTDASKVFTTADDDQTEVNVRVLQGETDVAAENAHLDDFQLYGITQPPSGRPRIEVTVGIDPDGIVDVEAEDLASSGTETVSVRGGTGLSEGEISSQRDRLAERVERVE